jgi:signal transduction histidine kinase
VGDPRATDLAELSRLLAETGVDYGSVLRALAERVGALLGDGCVVELIDADGRTLLPVALHHPDPAACELACGLAREARSLVGTGVTGRVAHTGVPAVFPAVDPAALRALLAPPVQAYVDRFPVRGAISVPLRTRDGVIGALSVWRDRTEALYTQDDVDFLQRLGDHAALAITNARLYRRLQKAHDALEARTEHLQAALAELESFSWAVSHDLQVPLRGIRGLIDIFLEDHGATLDEAGRELLCRATDAADRMSALILALLDLARVSSAALRREPQDVSALAADVAAELAAAWHDRHPRVDIQDGLVAHGDRMLLRVALQNLLSNAWKFTAGRADPALRVTGGSDGDLDVVEVRDNGVGFDMAHAERLFRPFQRLHTGYPGTGIGLATVHRIVRRHGGRVTATAAPDQGACFRLELPRRLARPDDDVNPI